MSTFKKHVGRIRNTDRRCVVVYMQIPGNEENALIVDTDALPDRFHDALMDIIDSSEGQQTPHLHSLLSRRILPDLGLDMMNALHTYGQLRPVDIDNIVMYPAPNAPCPLRTIVDFMNGETAPEENTTRLENRVLENQRSDTAQAQQDIAQNILRQADDLQNEANRKREQAYRLVPNLRPDKTGDSTQSTFVSQVTDSPEVIEASDSADQNTTELLIEGQMIVQGSLRPTVSNGEFLDGAVGEYNIVEDDMPTTIAAPLGAEPYSFNPSNITDLNEGVTLPVAALVNSPHTEETEEAGNQVDTSDSAIQEFLDRAALREDMSDREKWEAAQPKNPVGRPRKDGSPAGSKEIVQEKPRRGRPPKAKK